MDSQKEDEQHIDPELYCIEIQKKWDKDDTCDLYLIRHGLSRFNVGEMKCES